MSIDTHEAPAARVSEGESAPDIEQFLTQCERRWPAQQSRPRVVTRAPGRLDCMGGMADCSGALALQMPIAKAVIVAAGRRDDQRVAVEALGLPGSNEAQRVDFPISRLYGPAGSPLDGPSLAAAFAGCTWGGRVAGVLSSLLRCGELPHLSGGFNLLICSDVPSGVGLAASAAVEVAVARAVTALFDIELDTRRVTRVCRIASTEVAGALVGLVDHITCMEGQEGALLQVRCSPQEVLGLLPLPKDVSLVAVDMQMRSPIYAQRYEENRICSLMGKHLIERLARSAGANGELSAGSLAGIAPCEYVRRFRNELPVKTKGREFLARYGCPAGLEGLVEADRIYKVRSRTEHHIYENDRTHRMMERLARARRTGERDALVEAGELMYASHWSYGQRCGMASIEADALVNAIRQRGAARGLYGAKVTAGGCGGSLAVLSAATAQASEALTEACDEFTGRTGHPVTILIGSSPGAAAFGVRYLDDHA